MAEIILNTDDKAAKYLTNIKGWVDINGRYWGSDERMCRWSSATHIECAGCGKPTLKSHTACSDCRQTKRDADYYNYKKKPFKDWPIAIHDSDEYFFCADQLSDYCHDNDTSPNKLMLVHCEPNHLGEIDSDLWSDVMPEDEYSLPDEVNNALIALNDAIRASEPVSFSATKVAVSNPEELTND